MMKPVSKLLNDHYVLITDFEKEADALIIIQKSLLAMPIIVVPPPVPPPVPPAPCCACSCM